MSCSTIRVYLRVCWPVGPVSENPELLVIPGFRVGTLGLWTTRTALSRHVCLFDKGRLPSYAFPTDLYTFYVFEYERDRVRITERPQQGKSTAVSEYALGRLLVVNKQRYRVGGIHIKGTNSATPGEALFAGSLGTYVYCPLCTCVREGPRLDENEYG